MIERKSFRGQIQKGVIALFGRLRRHGMRVTVLWLYARGVPYFTGVPILKYSQITPQIYVGSQFNEVGKQTLERAGITGDVNMRIEFDDAAHGLNLEHYCYLPTVDDHAPTIEHLNEGVAFIEQIIADGGKVYIHCAGGIGRAPTMATAYFITQGYSLADAEALIKKSRPFIRITPPQRAQLEKFEALHRTAEESTDAS